MGSLAETKIQYFPYHAQEIKNRICPSVKASYATVYIFLLPPYYMNAWCYYLVKPLNN